MKILKYNHPLPVNLALGVAMVVSPWRASPFIAIKWAISFFRIPTCAVNRPTVEEASWVCKVLVFAWLEKQIAHATCGNWDGEREREHTERPQKLIYLMSVSFSTSKSRSDGVNFVPTFDWFMDAESLFQSSFFEKCFCWMTVMGRQLMHFCVMSSYLG